MEVEVEEKWEALEGEVEDEAEEEAEGSEVVTGPEAALVKSV